MENQHLPMSVSQEQVQSNAKMVKLWDTKLSPAGKVRYAENVPKKVTTIVDIWRRSQSACHMEAPMGRTAKLTASHILSDMCSAL